jgi:hypothetical protein
MPAIRVEAGPRHGVAAVELSWLDRMLRAPAREAVPRRVAHRRAGLAECRRWLELRRAVWADWRRRPERRAGRVDCRRRAEPRPRRRVGQRGRSTRGRWVVRLWMARLMVRCLPIPIGPLTWGRAVLEREERAGLRRVAQAELSWWMPGPWLAQPRLGMEGSMLHWTLHLGALVGQGQAERAVPERAEP